MAARGNCILITADPKGYAEEIIVSGTPKPGTVMELKGSVAEIGGRRTFEAAGTTAANSTYSGMAADGNRIPIAVLLCAADPWGAAINPWIGHDVAYADGDHGVVYYPSMGEELNMLIKDESGTGADQDFSVGDKLIVDDGTGKLLRSASTPESEPFIILEALTDLAADVLAPCQYTGC
jgi:hypothetical protein